MSAIPPDGVAITVGISLKEVPKVTTIDPADPAAPDQTEVALSTLSRSLYPLTIYGVDSGGKTCESTPVCKWSFIDCNSK
jgi:hypothetical protein